MILYKFQNITINISELDKFFRLYIFYNEIKGQMDQSTSFYAGKENPLVNMRD